ncbi:ligase-associated DNA damage response DEXH box helicase [Sphingobacterium alkalisoli]|uniref:Ligase-associated DNA damage response DEXH box helicase n=1 Tax=Sphingobacterium alkalisoli TaxID=1874115 RepID=A0A4U0H0Q2_9SPHI|nr:ligase-associated DNA damage response DEXH box helicase [Sphingobacterium alkalisoli]TJY63782.1 ligase-associated DNA damage response DEXH box helicase [Sphingobacterium alkalisoli]GGH24909.1 DNA ligase-associated DEXH box helicase [Sphingobacterium alkalisoli]
MNQLADVWFFNQGWKPHAFQKEAWKVISKGNSGLLNAPTGFGKTFGIWFGILDHYYNHPQFQKKKTKKKQLHALWITPLRALSKEIYKAATQVSTDLELDYKIELRTGDTSSADRQKQRKNPPQALITTPESVHLLLASKGATDYFKQLEFIVVDEWHELLGSKRGVLIELALSRLKAINPMLKIWGISATIGNLPEAQEILLGHHHRGVMVKANLKKKIQIETILPDSLEKFPWAGHLGVRLLDKVVDIIRKYHSTLIFTNTRSQAEIWYQQIITFYPEFAGLLAIHHGSLSDEIRLWVEDALHEGKLKAVVCTSSLDLGVDFRPVDCVIQIGSPKGVARFLQRAGRSGHRPHETSYIYYLPTNSLEIIEGDSLKYAVKENIIEQRIPYIRSFDVLVQYLMTLAVGDGFDAVQLFSEVKGTHCFSSISREEFDQCMALLLYGGAALTAYDDFHRLELVDGLYKVTSRKLALRHRLSIGAIVSDIMMRVKFMSGKYLGSIEESFISKLNSGDVFWFSGRQLELIQVRANDAIVKPSEKKKGVIPSWMGGRFAISPDLGTAIRHSFSNIHKDKVSSPEIEFLRPLFVEQSKRSILPKEGELLVEYMQTKYGFHLFLYPFDGKLVHEGMAQVIAYRLGKIKPATFSIATNEYGIELLTDTEYEIDVPFLTNLLTPHNLHADISSGINVQEMARRRFRDIAGIAGLVFQGYPGKQMKSKHLQANSGLFFSVFEDYDPNNLLLREAYDEVFDFQLEEGRMQQAFERIADHHIVLAKPLRLTPFSFPIFSESFRERYSNEDWQSRLEKLKGQLLDG